MRNRTKKEKELLLPVPQKENLLCQVGGERHFFAARKTKVKSFEGDVQNKQPIITRQWAFPLLFTSQTSICFFV
jgi:hypothetical protein